MPFQPDSEIASGSFSYAFWRLANVWLQSVTRLNFSPRSAFACSANWDRSDGRFEFRRGKWYRITSVLPSLRFDVLFGTLSVSFETGGGRPRAFTPARQDAGKQSRAASSFAPSPATRWHTGERASYGREALRTCSRRSSLRPSSQLLPHSS